MLVLAAVLILIPFVALGALAIAGVLSAIGVFYEVRDRAAVAAEEARQAAEQTPAATPVTAESFAA